VTLARADGLRLTIEDDGTGIPMDTENGSGFGLVSMRERAQALGGTMQVAAAGERGARVEVWLP
jgi:signal transduction histidine kinase